MLSLSFLPQSKLIAYFVTFLVIPVICAYLWTRLPFLPHSMALARARKLNAQANFTGRLAVVVGGTAGIGKGIAMRLAQANFTVTIVGRNAERGQEVVESLTQKGGSGHKFISCDAQHIRNLRAFAKTFSEEHESLDVLVETQGIATTQGRTETEEELDQKMAIHYYGRMALIEAFLPLLRAAPSARVLSVLSAGVHSPYSHYETDPELKENYSLKNAADAAGFYNDIGLDSFARQSGNENITFIHAAPGFVNTNWGTELPFLLRGLVRVVQPLGTSIEDCAEFMCLPLLSPDEDQPHTGEVVLIGSKGETVSKTSLHDEARDAVWKHTQDVLGRIE
jgi:NAD(P)-dependent dehydrogenase (short-subunit alcohol dehydrogenase family)